ncbi:MAG: hypothetical protein JWO65_348 [Sphingomonas bacterium]|jgi:hypothetical protein|nr:hypothetical protein [Sphingomonas bacterium]
MAYLDLREHRADDFTPAFARFADPGFGNEEWTIIALARRDGLASLSEPGRLSRALAWAFGARIALRLADPKLETLRRLAVFAWHNGYAVPVSSIKAFLAAGFTADQLELLLASISVQRPTSYRRARA